MIELLVNMGATGALLCVLLAAFLLGVGGTLSTANRFLAVFLILTAIDLVGLVGLVLPVSVGEGLGYRSPLGFLQMPVFYAYVVTLCLPGQSFRWHLYVGIFLVLAALLDMALRTGGFFPVWAQAGLHLQYYVYIVLSLLALVRFQTGLVQTRSTDQAIQLRWLWAVVVTSFLAHGLVFTRTLAGWFDWPMSWSALQLASGATALLILCGLTLTALLRPGLFKRLAVSEVAAISRRAPALPSAQLEALARRARDFLAEHKSHLEPELSLKTLARRMGVGERELSQALNQALGLHFFDFINQTRIEHARMLIEAGSNREKTLLDIAFEAGFNSKSSFNTAFKKHSGLTPSAFRASLKKA